jgi:hypothetical protein
VKIARRVKNRVMEQQPEQQPEHHKLPGRPFPVGVSPNPQGRALAKIRLAAEVAALEAAFREVHHRVPTHYESVTLDNAARLQLRLRRPASAEDMVKMSNAVRRLLRSLGLDARPREPAAPLPSGRELLQRRNSR